MRGGAAAVADSVGGGGGDDVRAAADVGGEPALIWQCWLQQTQRACKQRQSAATAAAHSNTGARLPCHVNVAARRAHELDEARDIALACDNLTRKGRIGGWGVWDMMVA